MGKPFSRQSEVTQVCCFSVQTGSRAVFLAEARTKKEMRQLRELFDMVGQLAQVVPISHGVVMSYAVQVDGDASLFGKIEWLLKTQFTFSLVERNFSDVTFHLVRSLCEDSNTQMIELPECGICGSCDPFPLRASVEVRDEAEPLHLAYCSRCAARHAEEDPARHICALISRDRAGLRVSPDVPVTQVREIVEERPEWAASKLAMAG
jgi:hypothetical protein